MNAGRTFSFLWLLLLVAGVIRVQRLYPDGPPHFEIKKALTLGHDTFGRSCIDLTFQAAHQTFLNVIPLLLATLFFSLVTAVLRHYYRKQLDHWIKFFIDSTTVLPGLLIALSFSAYFPGSASGLWMACALILTPYLLRFWDGIVTETELRPYYFSAVALGATPQHLFWHYLLPELRVQLVAIVPFLFTRLILIETSFSFLGIGVTQREETWGGLLYQGKDFLLEAPWILASVSVPLFLTLFSFHLLSKPEEI